MSALNLFNIYEQSIENVYDTCTSALEEYGIEIDFETEVTEDLKELGNWEDIGNSLIHAMLYTTAGIIQGEKNIKCDFYVNGLDSHLYINGEEYYG